MDPLIEYKWFDSKKQEKEVKELLAPVLRFLPFWVQTLYVHRLQVHDDGGCVSCGMSMNARYRFATLTVYDTFFGAEDHGKSSDLHHEILHCQLEHIARWVAEDVLPLFEKSEPALVEYLKGQLRERLEATIEDLVHTIGEGLRDA